MLNCIEIVGILHVLFQLITIHSIRNALFDACTSRACVLVCPAGTSMWALSLFLPSMRQATSQGKPKLQTCTTIQLSFWASHNLLLYILGEDIKTKAWILRKLVSVLAGAARRPHIPRSPEMRQLFRATGIEVPESNAVGSLVAVI